MRLSQKQASGPQKKPLLIDFWSRSKARKGKRTGMSPETRAMYDTMREAEERIFRGHAADFNRGDIEPEEFEERMREDLKEYYIALALLAQDGSFTRREERLVREGLAETYTRLSDFRAVLELNRLAQARGDVVIYSPQRIEWRSSRYSFAWDRFSRFAVPSELFDALPAFPGYDCEGGPLCGCWLDWESTDDALHVYWHLDHAKENCVLCTGFAVDWQPLVIEVFEFLEDDDFEDVDLDVLEDLL